MIQGWKAHHAQRIGRVINDQSFIRQRLSERRQRDEIQDVSINRHKRQPVFVSYTNTREIIWDYSLSMMFH